MGLLFTHNTGNQDPVTCTHASHSTHQVGPYGQARKTPGQLQTREMTRLPAQRAVTVSSRVIAVTRRGTAHTPGDDEHPSMCANCSPTPLAGGTVDAAHSKCAARKGVPVRIRGKGHKTSGRTQGHPASGTQPSSLRPDHNPVEPTRLRDRGGAGDPSCSRTIGRAPKNGRAPDT